MGACAARRWAFWGLLAFAFASVPSGSVLAGDGKDPKGTPKDTKVEPAKETLPVIDAARVYFGKATTCKAPAVVDSGRVFKAIPEYKKILEKKLAEKDAEYSILMVKANRRFRAAIEKAATEGGYDLVAQVGAVTWEGHAIPDLTESTIRKVEEGARQSP